MIDSYVISNPNVFYMTSCFSLLSSTPSKVSLSSAHYFTPIVRRYVYQLCTLPAVVRARSNMGKGFSLVSGSESFTIKARTSVLVKILKSMNLGRRSDGTMLQDYLSRKIKWNIAERCWRVTKQSFDLGE